MATPDTLYETLSTGTIKISFKLFGP